jgi:hypothetical protein
LNNRLLSFQIIVSCLILFSGFANAQKNASENSGDCTVLVQGNNNNVTLSGTCAPTKNVHNTNASGSDQIASAAGKPDLQFTVREFVIDSHTQTVYASMAVANRSSEQALVQMVTAASTIQLSDPPATVSSVKVEGLGTCTLAVRFCLDRAADVDFTTVPAAQTAGFRIIGRVGGRFANSYSKSGSLSFVFLRKVGSKYEKLDVSFLDVKLTESP